MLGLALFFFFFSYSLRSLFLLWSFQNLNTFHGLKTFKQSLAGKYIAHSPLKMHTITAGIYNNKWRERWRKYTNHKLQEMHKSLGHFIITQTERYPFKTCQITPDIIPGLKLRCFEVIFEVLLVLEFWLLLRSQQCCISSMQSYGFPLSITVSSSQTHSSVIYTR